VRSESRTLLLFRVGSPRWLLRRDLSTCRVRGRWGPHAGFSQCFEIRPLAACSRNQSPKSIDTQWSPAPSCLRSRAGL